MNVIITGASKGIGYALAQEFASNGHQLCLCARGEEELNSVKQHLEKVSDQKIHAEICDVSKPDEIERFGDRCLSIFDHIDVLINNAGFFVPGDIHTEENGLLERMMQTNVYSAYHLCRKIIPRMQEVKKGLIVNISSVAGLQAYPQGGSYSISKFALTGLSKNLRQELKSFGIKVSTVYPGATFSDSWKGSGVEEDRIMEATDIAKSVYALTQLSDKAVVEDIILRPQLGDL
jgi:short-subunit dehydrogenase